MDQILQLLGHLILYSADRYLLFWFPFVYGIRNWKKFFIKKMLRFFSRTMVSHSVTRLAIIAATVHKFVQMLGIIITLSKLVGISRTAMDCLSSVC